MNLNKISSKHIKEYQNLLAQEGASEKTIKRRSSSLRRFFHWANNHGYLEQNPLVEKSSSKLFFPKAIQPPKRDQFFQLARLSVGVTIIVLLTLFLSNRFFPYIVHYLPTPGEVTTPVVATYSPWIINFRGKLTTNDGEAISHQTTVVFRLYDQAENDQFLWESKAWELEPNSEGEFQASLGDVTQGDYEIPNQLFFQKERLYLGIVVDGQPEISPRIPVSTAAHVADSYQLGEFPPSQAPEGNMVPVLTSEGYLILAAASPMIKSTSGTLAIEGQAITIATLTGSDGDITLAPDGVGGLNLLFNTPTGEVINAIDANLGASGGKEENSLYYGYVGNDNTNYYLLKLESGSTPYSRFTVDALGNTAISGNLTVGGDNLQVDTLNSRVGINTASPDYSLDVAGEARISETIYNLYNKPLKQGNESILTADGWYRIAQTSNRASGLFNLMNITSDRYQSIYFYASVANPDSNNKRQMSLNLLANVRHDLDSFSKLRLIRNGASDPVYLEVYIGNASNNTVRYILSQNDWDSGWTPVDWQAGEIPSGYVAIEYPVTNIEFSIDENFLVITDNGNVGIGMADPSYKLDVAGDIRLSDNLYLTDDNWIGIGGTEERIIFDTAGNIALMGAKVGLGTTAPSEELDVIGNATISGTLALGPQTEAYAGTCDASAEGKMYYDASQNEYYYCDGSSWTAISSGTGSVGGSGTANYLPKWFDSDTLTDSVIYDDGTNVGIGTTAPGAKLDVLTAGYGLDSLIGVRGKTIATGTIGSAYGGYFEAVDASFDTITSGYGAYAHVYESSGEVQTGYGLYSECDDATTCYGLYVAAGDDDPTTDWGIYVTGEDKNYFSGNVGIGTTGPEAKLEIEAAATDTTILKIDGSTNPYSGDTSVKLIETNLLIAGQSFSLDDDERWLSGINNNLDNIYDITDLTTYSEINTDAIYNSLQLYIDLESGDYDTSSSIQANAALNSTLVYLDLKDTDSLGGISLTGTYSLNGVYPTYTVANSTPLYVMGTKSEVAFNPTGAQTSSAVANIYGEWIRANGTTEGTQNLYGIYLDSGSGGADNNYALYSAFNADSYFAGNVGIGTTDPTAELDVSGTASVSALTIRGTSPGYINQLNGNDLRFRTSTGGDAGLTPRMTITNAGNVGIGTTGPGAKLEVSTLASNIIGQIINYRNGGIGLKNVLDNWASTASTAVENNIGGDYSNQNVTGVANVWNGSDNYIAYGFRNYVKSGGNLFSDTGNSTFYGLSNVITKDEYRWVRNATFYGIYNDISTDDDAQYETGNETVYGIYSKGTTFSVGTDVFYGSYVGTSSTSTGGTQYAYYANMASGTATKWGLYLTGEANNYISGNVGIGTSTPTAKLDVAGDASTSGSLVFRGTSPATIDILNGDDLRFQTSVGGDAVLTPRMTITNAGNVGIGTTAPTTTLSIVSSASSPIVLSQTGSTGISFSSNWPTLALNMWHDGTQWRALGNGYTALWNQNPSTGLMSFSLSGSSATAGQALGSYLNYERIVINNTGNVGIGTTNPTELLDVAGDIRSTTGTLQIGNSANLAYNRLGTGTASDGDIGDASDLYLSDSLEVGGNATISGTLSAYKFQTPYQKTVTVAKAGGDYLTITDALNSLTTCTSSAPCLIQVMPGTYAEQVTMKEYVDIKGSGWEVTIIDPPSNGIALYGEDNSRISDIKIQNAASYGTPVVSGTNVASADSFYMVNVYVNGSTDAAGLSNGYATIYDSIIYSGNGWSIGGGTFEAHNTAFLSPTGGNSRGIAGTVSLWNCEVTEHANICPGSYIYNTRFDEELQTSCSNGTSYIYHSYVGGNLNFEYPGSVLYSYFTHYEGNIYGGAAGRGNYYSYKDTYSTTTTIGVTNTLAAYERRDYIANSIYPLFTVTQKGTGDIVNILDDTTEVFTILDGGNVGIGNTTPVSKLQISGTNAGKALAIFNESGTVNDIFTASSSGSTKFTLSNSGNITFSGSANTITNANQLTLSTTGASSDLVLSAGRDITFDDDNLSSPVALSVADSALNANLTQGIIDAINEAYDAAVGSGGISGFWTKTLGLLFPNNTYESVAIGGTATSSAKLYFEGTTGNASMSGQLTLHAAGTNYLNALSGQALSLRTSAGGDAGLTDRLYISNAGSVGIGTTAPSEKLTLAGGNLYHYASGNPTLKSTVGNNFSTGVYVSGQYAYVAATSTGLQIIDVSNPSSPSVVGTYNTDGQANYVYVSGKYAYVADGATGLQIIDVSNPSSPSLLGTYDSDSAYAVYVSGQYAYVANGATGLKIIDVSNPSSPSLAGSYDLDDSRGVYVLGKYAYVADMGQGLRIVDVSNPNSPSLAGSYTVSTAGGVYVSGKYAYLACGTTNGLKIINVSNPSSPSLAGTYFDASSATGAVYVSGKYAYVVDRWAGLRIIDVSNPSSTSLVGSYDLSDAEGVFVSGKYAYVNDWGEGLRIIDINGIETPSLYAGNIQTNDITATENIDVGNNLYVRNGINAGPGGIFTDGRLSVSGISYFGSNVGIGTTTPLGALHIDKNTSLNPALIVNQLGSGNIIEASSSGTRKFFVTTDGSINSSGYATVSGSLAVGYSSVLAGTGNAAFAGKVGIGTTNPSQKLEVASGDILLSDTSNGKLRLAYGGQLYDQSSRTLILANSDHFDVLNEAGSGHMYEVSSTNHYFYISNAIKVLIDSSGYLGINTSFPTAHLDVGGDASTSGSLVFRGTNKSIDILNGSRLDFQTSVGGDAVLTPRMTITNAGNVGIGTANPIYGKLEVDGAGGYQYGISLYSGTGGSMASSYLKTDGGSDYNWHLTRGGNDTRGIVIDKDGEVGIGTSSPGSLLSLGSSLANTKLALYDGGSAFYGMGIQANDFRFHVWSSAADFNFYDAPAGNALMTIKGTGNVGIGTTTPTAKLDIAGDASTSGSLVFRGTSPATIDILNGDDLRFQTSVGGDTVLTPRMTITNAGNVGIGTTNPNQKLDIAGNATISGTLALGPQTRAYAGNCDASAEGKMYYDASTDKYYYCNGSSWTEMGAGAAELWEAGIYGTYEDDAAVIVGADADFTHGIAEGVGDLRVASDMEVLGNSYFGGTSNYLNISSGGDLSLYGTADTIDVSNVTGTKLIISGGYVGIGTTAPNEQLEITGNFRMPATTATTGIIKMGADRYLHSYYDLSNTFLGVQAGNLTMTGTGDQAKYNTAIGYQALDANTTGYANTAIGYRALSANDTGYGNFAAGRDALITNTSGYNNYAIGTYALYYNTDGNYNTAIGESTLESNSGGDNNVAIGFWALKTNSSGNRNIAFGPSALRLNSSGSDNIAMGSESLYTNTGSNNIAIGTSTLDSGGAITGNIAIGMSATRYTTGNYNTALGTYAAFYQGTGSNNVFLGYQAGMGSSPYNASGNILIGYQAGYNETNSNKLYIENSNSSSPLIWGDFSTNILGINGKVGIGTTAPTAELDVSGTASVSALTIRGTSPGYINQINGNDLQFRTSAGGDTELTTKMTLSNAGNLSIEGQLSDLSDNTLTINDSLSLIGNALPSTGSTYDLGSSSLPWNNAYANNIFGSSSGTQGFWTKTAGVLYPNNTYESIAVGGTSTASAKLLFSGPTGNASMSGTLTLFGTSPAITTTNMRTLTLGDADTGNVVIYQDLQIIGNDILDSTSTTRLTLGAITAVSGSLTITQNLKVDTDTFFVDASTNRVGIGTTNPQAKLDIAGANSLISNSSGDITLDAFSGYISFSSDYISNLGGIYGDLNVTGNILNSTAERPVKISDWTLIQTSTPSAALMVDQTGVGDIFTASTSGVAKFTINNAGRLVNSLIPAATNAYDLGSSTYYWKDLYLEGSTIYFDDTTDATIKYNTSNSYFAFDPDGDATPNVVMTDAGNVGIGTTAPSDKLHVIGNTTVTSSSDSTDYFRITNDDTWTTFNRTTNGGTTGNAIQFNSGGTVYFPNYVGIGTTNPIAKLEVVGGNIVAPYGDTYGFGINRSGAFNKILYQNSSDVVILNNPNNSDIRFIRNGSTVLNIDTSNRTTLYGSSGDQWRFNYVAPASNYAEYYSSAEGAVVGVNYFVSTRESKMDFQPLSEVVDSSKIYDLELLGYNYKSDPPGTPKTIGLIAEDTAEILPVIVSFDNENNPHHINFGLLSVLNLDQIQKINQRLKNLEGDVYLTDTGDLYLEQVGEEFVLKDSEGNLIERVGAFAELVVANFKAGLIQTQELIADSLTVNQKLVSPVIESSQIIAENIETTRIDAEESEFGKLLIENEEGETVASIDSAGNVKAQSLNVLNNASFGGLLASEELIVSENATIAGELHVGKIYADEIVGRKATFGDLLAATISADTVDRAELEEIQARLSELEGKVSVSPPPEPTATPTLEPTPTEVPTATESGLIELPPESTDSGLLNEAANWSLSDPSDDIFLTSDITITGDLTSLGTTSLADTSVAGQLMVDATVIIDKDGIQTLPGSNLKLQAYGWGGIDMLDGKVVIDTEGNVLITGDLTAKKINTGGLVLTESANTSECEANESECANESGFGKLLSVLNKEGLEVASIDASGSAFFAQLGIKADYTATQSGAIIAAAQNYYENGYLAPAIKTNATAGIGILPANEEEVMIYNPQVTAESLIYVTATTNTENKVLYVKAKHANTRECQANESQCANDGYFIVALNESLTKDIQFNWWIVGGKPPYANGRE